MFHDIGLVPSHSSPDERFEVDGANAARRFLQGHGLSAQDIDEVQFKEDIIQAFHHAIKHKPATTFGNVKADVLAGKDPSFRRINFCDVIRASAWRG
jgi:hypothetical protein